MGSTRYDSDRLQDEEAGSDSWAPRKRNFRPSRLSSCLCSSRHIALKLTGSLLLLLVLGLYACALPTSFTSQQRKPLTILVSGLDASIGEVDFWIHNVLSRLDRPVDVQVQYTHELKVLDDSVIIGFNDLGKWGNLVRDSGLKNVGLLRIGDEHGNDTLSSYEHFAYAFRPYFFPHINSPIASSSSSFIKSQPASQQPLWIPNGYSAGVGPRLTSTLLPYTSRPQLCYFEGSGRDNGSPSSREKMRSALMQWDVSQEKRGVSKNERIHCDVRWTSGFMQGVPPVEYSSKLARAKYALSPAGDSPETIRFYEAMENNAIPIVVYEPWMEGAFGGKTQADYPFIVLESWYELGPKLEALAAEDPVVGQARQLATRKWWENLQSRISKDAAKIVNKSFSQKYGTRS